MKPLAAFVVLVAAAPALAQEHVLFEVQGKETLLGTIRPADERESILCRMSRGSVIKAVAKSIDKAGPVPALTLSLGGDPVDGAETVVKGRGVSLLPLAAPATGLYKLAVTGDGAKDGDYQVVVSWKYQKKFSGAGTSAGQTTFGFAAPPHATVTVTLKAAKGSPFVPHLVALDGPMGAGVAFAGGGTGTAILPAQGDWTVRFASDAAEGAYTISVKVAAPLPAKHTFDIRDGSLSGSFSDGPDVVGAVIQPDDGGSVGVTDPGSPIAGSSVDIPPGSLSQTTSVFVAESKPYVPPGSDVPAGPAVEFGPSGTQFDSANPAKITIPFNPGDFPGGTDSLVVYVKDSEGNIEPVLPTTSYVFGAGTVTFTTSHFSVFQAATSAPRGPLAGDFHIVEMFGTPVPVFGGNSGVGLGSAFFGSNGATFLTTRQMVHFDSGQNPDSPGPPTVALEEGGGQIRLTVVQAGDSDFALAEEGTGFPQGRLIRGSSDDVLVMRHLDNAFTLGSTLFVRRSDQRPTLGALAGRWHVIVWEVSARLPAAGDTTLPLFVTAEAGSAVIDAAGAVSFKMSGGIKRFSDYPGGRWNTENLGKRSAKGTLVIDSDFIPDLSFGDPDVNIGFSVGSSGDLLVAMMKNFDRGFGTADVQTGLMFLVRESSGATAAGIAGSYANALGALGLEASADPPDPLGVKWVAQTGEAVLGADSTVRLNYHECRSGFPSDGGMPTIETSDVDDQRGVAFSISSDGAFVSPGYGVQGASVPGGSLSVYLTRRPTIQGLGFLLRKPTP